MLFSVNLCWFLFGFFFLLHYVDIQKVIFAFTGNDPITHYFQACFVYSPRMMLSGYILIYGLFRFLLNPGEIQVCLCILLWGKYVLFIIIFLTAAKMISLFSLSFKTSCRLSDSIVGLLIIAFPTFRLKFPSPIFGLIASRVSHYMFRSL